MAKLVIHHVEPLKTNGPAPLAFATTMDRDQRDTWARQLPVWSRFVPFHATVTVVNRAEDMIGGDEAIAAGLPLCVFASNAGEYSGQNLHFFVNEDGTRGALLTAAGEVDEEAAALAFVRRDQGYGPGTDFPS